MRIALPFLAAATLTLSTNAPAQTSRIATFVSVRGKDTSDIEQYRRVGDTIVGVWVQHDGDIAVHDYWLTLGADGLPTRYRVKVTHPYGDRPLVTFNQYVEFGADSATVLDSVPKPRRQRVAMRGGAYPQINFVLRFDLGLMRLRSAGANSGSILTFGANRMMSTPNGPMMAPPGPEALPVSFSTADSVLVGTALMSVDGDGHLLAVRFDDGQEVQRGATADMAKVIAGFVAAAASSDSARTIVLPAASLDKFVGTYADRNLETSVTRDGEKLFMTVNAQPAFQLVPQSPTKFFVRGRLVRLEFETDASGVATGLIVRQGPNDIRLPRTKASP